MEPMGTQVKYVPYTLSHPRVSTLILAHGDFGFIIDLGNYYCPWEI